VNKGTTEEPEKGRKRDWNRRIKGARKKRDILGNRRRRGGRYAAKMVRIKM
jgi:hypothetical protein